jgi:hypothetical protein
MTDEDILRGWYLNNEVTDSEFEILMDAVIRQGKRLPTTANAAIQEIVWGDFNRQPLSRSEACA